MEDLKEFSSELEESWSHGPPGFQKPYMLYIRNMRWWRVFYELKAIPGLCPVVISCPHIISTGYTWPAKGEEAKYSILYWCLLPWVSRIMTSWDNIRWWQCQVSRDSKPWNCTTAILGSKKRNLDIFLFVSINTWWMQHMVFCTVIKS